MLHGAYPLVTDPPRGNSNPLENPPLCQPPTLHCHNFEPFMQSNIFTESAPKLIQSSCCDVRLRVIDCITI